MYKKSQKICKRTWLLLLTVFFSVNLFAEKTKSSVAIAFGNFKSNLIANNERLPVLFLKADQPRLSIKSSKVDGNRLIVTLNISVINDAVLKALNEIKNSNKPNAFVAYEFYVFDVNKTTGTLKIELGKNLVNQEELLKFLQKNLDDLINPQQ